MINDIDETDLERQNYQTRVAINLMSMFAPVAQNRPEIDPFSLQVAAPSGRCSRISCFPSLRTSVSPCRGAQPFSPSVGSRGCTWRPHFFSPRRVDSRRVVAKIHADFSRGSLRCARVRQPSGKKASLRPATLSPAVLSPWPFFILSTLPDVAVRETNL